MDHERAAADRGAVDPFRGDAEIMRRSALTRVSVHICTKDGIDPRLVAAFAAEPFEKIGVQSHRHGLLPPRHDHSRRFPESLVFASASSMIAAWTSSSFIERRRRQSVSGSVFEVVPEISSLMRFGPPRRNDVTLISFTISVDHRDLDAVDQADRVDAQRTSP
jgi:hypothetical protein